jgi:integrase
VRGHKRFKAGAWRLTVNATDPVTGERKPVYATVHAPNNRRGEAKADSELAKLVAQVESGRTMPTSGMTVD